MSSIVDEEFQIFDQYILLERIGKGGRGEVYLARKVTPTGLGKFVAIKRILPEYVKDNTTLKMFLSEANLAIKLKHSNVVSMLDTGCCEGNHYISMDFVEGQTLHSLLQYFRKEGKVIPLKYGLFVVSCVSLALEYARRATDTETGEPLRIVHRDISPHNIMLNYEGEVKVIDFGVAGADLPASEIANQNVMGKFGYMSPEQARGNTVDHRSDLFSLGIVFWELLSGERMYTRMPPRLVREKIINFHFESLMARTPELPEAVMTILQKLLAKETDKRYQKAREVYEDVNYILNSQFPGFTQERFRGLVRDVFKKEMAALKARLIIFSKTSNEMRANIELDDSNVIKRKDLRSDTFTGSVNIGEVIFRNLDDDEMTRSGVQISAKDFEELEEDKALILSLDEVKFEDREEQELEVQKLPKVESEDRRSSQTGPREIYEDIYNPYSEIMNHGKKGKSFRGFYTLSLVLLVCVSLLYFTEVGKPWSQVMVAHRFTKNVINSGLQLFLTDDQLQAVHGVNRSIASYAKVVETPVGPFYVKTSPVGAKIYIDGVLQPARSPVYVTVPKHGPARIEIKKPGYLPVTHTIYANNKHIQIVLKPVVKRTPAKKN